MPQSAVASLIAKAWEYATGYRKLLIGYVLMLCVAQGLSLSEPYIIGQLLNTVQEGSSSPQIFHKVMYYLGLYLALQITFWCFHGPARVLERILAFNIRTNYKKELFTFVTQLPVKWHKDNHSGENIDRINRASGALSDFVSSSFELVYTLIRLVGSHIILFFFLPQAAIISLCSSIVALGLIFAIDRKLFQQYKDLNLFENRIASAIHDYVTNIVTVITLRLEIRVISEVARRMLDALPLYKKNVIMSEAKWFVGTMIMTITIVAALSWYAWSTVGSGQVLLSGTFFTLFEYLRRIGGSFFDFAGKYSAIVRYSADVQSAESIHNSYRHFRKASSNSFLPEGWKEVKINNLSFTYEDPTNRVHQLKDVTIDLKRGSRIAFVGESGSGKTTMMNVLRGLQFTKRVSVTCDGAEMENKLLHLARHTTLIPQEPEIFADTLRFNITFGVETPEAEILEAIKLARFEPVLGRMPFGLETNIAQKGINMSGGEKQRLALARGVFSAKDSDIILLDEPTSSVDSQNEVLIYEALLAHFKDRCVVSSIHKLHLLGMFDRIYVFAQGEIIEQGNLSELLAKQGNFAQMWKKYTSTTTIPTKIPDPLPQIN
ncbi:MAG: ABC transporter ATP-binding protein/permease [Oligoflexia bacterium]|nr:ABC transporter ATP-binding protein/permease [Oligoflexia bacterium]